MKHTVLFLLFGIFIDKIHLIEFNVFGNLTEVNDFGCYTNVIIQCIVASNIDPLYWQVGKPINSTTATAAQCSKFSCAINPILSNLYDFSYDETSGESNMTIKNVTLAEDGKQYKCDDGSTSSIFDSVVQVPPVKETTRITSMGVSGTSPGTTQIMVSTGCVTPKTADLVTFNWFIINTGGNIEAYEEAILETSRDESPCQISSDCIANGSAALSNKCTIEEDLDAPEVYFLVKILLRKRELFTIKTSSTFRPKICSNCRCWIVVVICIVISRILYVQTWLLGYSLYRRPAGKIDKNDEQSFEILMILLTGVPCIGLISSIWAFLKTGEYQKCPKWFKRVLETGFIIGCIQPGFGLFITGTACATYVQHGSVLLFTSVLFILLVGTELALIIVCIVLEIDCYYYILIAVGYIVVWIIAVAIMVKRVYTIYMKNGKTTVPSVTKGGITSKESSVDDSGYVNLNCTCDLCGQHVLHTLKGFCLEQNMLLCNSCFSKHKCMGKHLNHNQHEAEGGRERYFPCEKKQRKGHRHLPAHGYCLVCRLYLCTECLIDHDEHELLWMPHHGAKTFDDICCFKTQTDRNSTIPLGFCKTCKMYMCKECMRSHKETHKETQHSIIYHQHEGAQTNPENCSECAKPMECYKLNVNKYLCADCYDSGFLWKKNLNSDEDSKTILKESKSCELHNEVGDGPAKYSPTDVFCVVCKLYLCKECFRVHRKFRERWIATHKENLFTCKGCQENNNVFPVECFSIKSKAFLCATCFEENKSTSSHATEKYLRPETITRLSTKSDCELHKEPFQFEERKKSSTVYCLLCKTYMCDDCFKKHLHLKQVWNKKEMKRLHQTKSRNNEVSPMQTSM